ncbi:MAG: hypothetical protein KKF68_01765 [Nanoarchaeota archaeon]|nr:hypothetical protein [Nanoarchaeota archaeon]
MPGEEKHEYLVEGFTGRNFISVLGGAYNSYLDTLSGDNHQLKYNWSEGALLATWRKGNREQRTPPKIKLVPTDEKNLAHFKKSVENTLSAVSGDEIYLVRL